MGHIKAGPTVESTVLRASVPRLRDCRGMSEHREGHALPYTYAVCNRRPHGGAAGSCAQLMWPGRVTGATVSYTHRRHMEIMRASLRPVPVLH